MHTVTGLDFGTSNSAIAVAEPGKGATLAVFGDANSFRSILYFPPKTVLRELKPKQKLDHKPSVPTWKPTQKED